MRIEVNCTATDTIMLPISYNYFVQSMIYNLISNEEFATFLHDKGYIDGNKKFKLFSFSKLEGNSQYCPEDKTIRFVDKQVKLIITSPSKEFIQYIAETLLLAEEVVIWKNSLNIESVNIIDSIENVDELNVYTKTPIVVSSTLASGQTVFYSPMDYCFEERVKMNLITKYRAYSGDKNDLDFEVKVISKGIDRKKVIKYKNIYLNGYMCELKLKGNPKLIKFAYDAGLGEKNSMGFGLLGKKQNNK